MYFVPHFGHAKVYETSIWTPCFQISAKTLHGGSVNCPFLHKRVLNINGIRIWRWRVAKSGRHGLIQQGVWVPFWTLKRTPQETQIFLCEISKNLNLKLIIEFFHLSIIPMTLINDIMPYFDKFIHVYGWNMSILWYPLKIWTPKILQLPILGTHFLNPG